MYQGVGLLGGTFDPVHMGHVSIAKSFLESDFIEELWIILTPEPPHKTGNSITAFEIRKQMLKAAFGDFKRIKISEVERDLPKPSYTVQTIKFLKSKFSDFIFYLCIGEDSLDEFNEWYRWQEILNECELLVAKRPNSGQHKVDNLLKKHVHFVDHEPVNISSSKLREMIRDGKNIENHVPESVKKIIESNNLYRA